jgi:hypothetical protein
MLKDMCGLQIPELESIEIIRYPGDKTTNKQSFTIEGRWPTEQRQMPESSIGTSHKGLTESLSMQHSFGEIIRFMSKNSSMNKICEAPIEHKKMPALNSLVQEES